MDFANIVGNDRTKGYLQHMLATGRVGNSLLFAGCEGVGKSLFAQAVATAILCENDPLGQHRQKISRGVHTDLHVLRPEGKIALHSIDSVRRFTEEVYSRPNESAQKVLIIQDADRMLPTSANALLKTFEEPALRSVIILISSRPESLLPTVRSRCRKVMFQPVPQESICHFLKDRHGCSEEAAQRYAALAEGSIGRAVSLAQQGGDPLRSVLLALLAAGRTDSYKALGEALTPICDRFDALKEELEASLTDTPADLRTQDLSAIQKEAIQKEIEGLVSLRFREEVYLLLNAILGWYRDLHILYVGGNRQYLLHADCVESLEQTLQRGLLLPLEKVQEVINSIKLSVERSTPLRTCLESLFLQLDYG